MSRLAFARSAPLFCVAGTLACAGLARPERVYLDRVVAPEPVTAELDRTMREFSAEGFTGTVLVARGGRVLLYQGYGDANRARHLPNTAETKYPFGALANQFTATGFLQLESEGKLRLEAPATTWLGPEAGDVTLAELAIEMFLPAGAAPHRPEQRWALSSFGAMLSRSRPTKEATMKRKAKKTAKKVSRKSVKKVQAIPKDYNVVIPYLAIRGAARAIDFYKQAFGAKEVMRMPGPEGKIGHAEIRIADCKIMLSDEFKEMQMLGPQTRGGTSVMIHLYVKDVDATAAKAQQAGGTIVRPVANQFYGDRTCLVEDPFGHRWYLATHKEDLSMAELKKRAMQMAQSGG